MFHLPDRIGGARVALVCMLIEATGQALNTPDLLESRVKVARIIGSIRRCENPAFSRRDALVDRSV
jgi:hypothetical protein